MDSSQKLERKGLETARGSLHPRLLFNAFGRLFPRSQVVDAVDSIVHFDATTPAVWHSLMFYEEVKHRPGLLLRFFLPRPVSTQGGKTQVGGFIHCQYDSGTLVKRITAVEPERSIEFQVLEQELGLDGCISMTDGCYRLRPLPRGCEVVLTTRYRGHLRPRWLWQPLERYLARLLHRHILNGVKAEVS
jgi:hypothetical protein